MFINSSQSELPQNLFSLKKILSVLSKEDTYTGSKNSNILILCMYIFTLTPLGIKSHARWCHYP